MTVSGPSALISVTAVSRDLAADFESAPRWWLIEAITSSGVSDLPLWNSIPLRSLNIQVLAPFDASKCSERSPTIDPSASTSVRLERIEAQPQMPLKVSGKVAGSSESVVAPL